MLMAVPAMAVHDLDFQLEGDVLASTTTNVGNDATPQLLDWDSLFNNDGTSKAFPAGFTASGFDRDFNTNTNGSFNTSDQTTFATGSKDTLPITPGWQCNFDNNVNSKIDVMNAYAATYEAGGEEIIYFGLERNTNTGDANVGFWFLQDEVGCSSTGGAAPFTGDHVDGDLLIVSQFSNGGTVSTIAAYEWEGGANGALNPNPVASSSGDCKTTAGGDEACATANTGSISTPWLTSNKVDGPGNNLRTAEFFEGGLNLTDAGLGGKCFNTFMGDTRSSTSLTATLFDYSLGTLGDCSSSIVTTPQSGSGGAIPSTIGTAARVDVRDHADITVNGTDGAFDGTVKFFLCGPLALSSTTNCSTGGVQIGTPLAGETVSGTAGAASVNSDTATLTSAGRYCWRAEYSGDALVGVPPSSDPSKSVADGGTTSECFSIGPVTPVLTTTASADTVLGQSITDTASLTGTAKQPGTDGIGPGGTINATAGTQANAGGTITFEVRGPNNCNASGLTVTPSSVTVNGDNASYGPVSATPTAVGTYTFVATYSGNSPNTNGVGGSCPPLAGDGDEVVNVGGSASLSTAQRWLPNDTAHITSQPGTTLAGSVTFTLFPSADCTGTQAYTSGAINITTGSGTANDRTVSTNNTTFVVTVANDATAWSWLVHYDDAALQDPPDKCESTSTFTLTES